MIVENIGEIPDPQLYGDWLLGQEESAMEQAPRSSDSSQTGGPGATHRTLIDLKKGIDMKTRKLHTGVYSCPHCCLEFDLFAEESLKCDDCGGPLISGSLEDFCEDEQDSND